MRTNADPTMGLPKSKATWEKLLHVVELEPWKLG